MVFFCRALETANRKSIARYVENRPQKNTPPNPLNGDRNICIEWRTSHNGSSFNGLNFVKTL